MPPIPTPSHPLGADRVRGGPPKAVPWEGAGIGDTSSIHRGFLVYLARHPTPFESGLRVASRFERSALPFAALEVVDGTRWAPKAQTGQRWAERLATSQGTNKNPPNKNSWGGTLAPSNFLARGMAGGQDFLNPI